MINSIRKLDLIHCHSGKGQGLYLCTDYNSNDIFLSQITDDNGNIQNKEFNIRVTIIDPTISVVKWGGPECSSIMAGRALPGWCQARMGLGQTMPSSQSNSFPIGTIIVGAGSIGNIWIVWKHATLEVKQLWSGVQKTYLNGSTASTLSPGRNRNILTRSELIQHTGDSGIPTWAEKLIANTSGSASQQTQLNHPAFAALEKANIVKKPEPPKKNEKRAIDSFREKCNHRFLLYQGYTESYEYCEHCDVKKPVSH